MSGTKRSPLRFLLLPLLLGAASAPPSGQPSGQPSGPPAGHDSGGSPRAESSEPPEPTLPFEGPLLGAFRRAKLQAPLAERQLTVAAQHLARAVLEEGPSAAMARARLAEALDLAEGWEPAPRAIALRAADPGQLLRLFGARRDLAAGRERRFGLGLARGEGAAALVLLLSTPRASLEPFPRAVEVGSEHRLIALLFGALSEATLYTEEPGGAVNEAGCEPIDSEPEPGAPPGRLCMARVPFPAAGRYRLELVAEGPAGPQVVALFGVRAGRAPLEHQAPGIAAGHPAPNGAKLGLAAQEALALAAINRARAAREAPPLARSMALDRVARAHAEEMARLGYFAHRSPRTGTVASRLNAAGIPFLRAAENLGEAASALQAHEAIAASPGHLRNLLDPDFDTVGLAAVRVERAGIKNVLLVEVFVRLER